MKYKYQLKLFFWTIILAASWSCKKMITIDYPTGSIVTETAFSEDVSAEATVRGLYGNMINGSLKAINGGITVYAGMSADEFVPSSTSASTASFRNNVLTSMNSNVSTLWSNFYSYIYHANACIKGLSDADKLTPDVKKRLLGEVKFIRAFNYFYLLNLFGDVPLVTSIDWRDTRTLSRTSKQDVYTQIITDLKEAQDLLPSEYIFGEKIRANKWAATAFLARVYLYTQDWGDAEMQASDVINNGGFSLVEDLNSVYLKNSNEAILQLQPSGMLSPSYNGTTEAIILIPRTLTTVPSYYFTNQLKTAFEVDDQRLIDWTKTLTRNAITYSYPYKYKVRGTVNDTEVQEYYMVLRLAEQYLIRAEARVHQGKLIGTDAAEADINIIRARALLPATTATTFEEFMKAIEQERRIEMFSEWGHRWFDLKRMKGNSNPSKTRADEVLEPLKSPNWQSTDLLYPIPLSEIQINPKILQNDGY